MWHVTFLRWPLQELDFLFNEIRSLEGQLSEVQAQLGSPAGGGSGRTPRINSLHGDSALLAWSLMRACSVLCPAHLLLGAEEPTPVRRQRRGLKQEYKKRQRDLEELKKVSSLPVSPAPYYGAD